MRLFFCVFIFTSFVVQSKVITDIGYIRNDIDSISVGDSVEKCNLFFEKLNYSIKIDSNRVKVLDSISQETVCVFYSHDKVVVDYIYIYRDFVLENLGMKINEEFSSEILQFFKKITVADDFSENIILYNSDNPKDVALFFKPQTSINYNYIDKESLKKQLIDSRLEFIEISR